MRIKSAGVRSFRRAVAVGRSVSALQQVEQPVVQLQVLRHQAGQQLLVLLGQTDELLAFLLLPLALLFLSLPFLFPAGSLLLPLLFLAGAFLLPLLLLAGGALSLLWFGRMP